MAAGKCQPQLPLPCLGAVPYSPLLEFACVLHSYVAKWPSPAHTQGPSLSYLSHSLSHKNALKVSLLSPHAADPSQSSQAGEKGLQPAGLGFMNDPVTRRCGTALTSPCPLLCPPQNRSLAEVGRDLRVHLVQTLLRQGHPEQGAQHHVHKLLKISKEESLWATRAQSPVSTELFLGAQKPFLSWP